MEPRVENFSTLEYDFVYVNDTPELKDPNVPEYLQRWAVVGIACEKDLDTPILGYVVSKYDFPSCKIGLYSLHAYKLLAKRLGFDLDERELANQWHRRHQRHHRLRDREKIDISAHPFSKYFRDLVAWSKDQPMFPEFPKVLNGLIRKYGGEEKKHHYAGEIYKAKRAELLKKWDAYVAKCVDYAKKYKEWFAMKPKSDGFSMELKAGAVYLLGKGVSTTKTQIDFLAQSQPMNSKIERYHPITGEMVMFFEM
jgi:hypothetical protein